MTVDVLDSFAKVRTLNEETVCASRIAVVAHRGFNLGVDMRLLQEESIARRVLDFIWIVLYVGANLIERVCLTETVLRFVLHLLLIGTSENLLGRTLGSPHSATFSYEGGSPGSLKLRNLALFIEP